MNTIFTTSDDKFIAAYNTVRVADNALYAKTIYISDTNAKTFVMPEIEGVVDFGDKASEVISVSTMLTQMLEAKVNATGSSALTAAQRAELSLFSNAFVDAIDLNDYGLGIALANKFKTQTTDPTLLGLAEGVINTLTQSNSD